MIMWILESILLITGQVLTGTLEVSGNSMMMIPITTADKYQWIMVGKRDTRVESVLIYMVWMESYMAVYTVEDLSFVNNGNNIHILFENYLLTTYF